MVFELWIISQVVVHENINPNDYYTISATGVTRLRDNETEYTTLGSWEKEYRDYQILIKIKTFSNFRMWKAFAVWRKNVRTKKISQCKNDLSENLFIVNDVSYTKSCWSTLLNLIIPVFLSQNLLLKRLNPNPDRKPLVRFWVRFWCRGFYGRGSGTGVSQQSD